MRKAVLIFSLVAILCSTMPVNAAVGELGDTEGETWLSEDIQQACIDIGSRYNICPELLEAIIERESWGKANATNGSCKGLMQVSASWHRERMKKLGVSDIYDPYGNILVACDYLHELFEEYEDVGTVLMVYHGESHAVSKEELSSYAATILERSEKLERIHYQEEEEAAMKELEEKHETMLHMQSLLVRYGVWLRPKFGVCTEVDQDGSGRWLCTYHTPLIYHPVSGRQESIRAFIGTGCSYSPFTEL